MKNILILLILISSVYAKNTWLRCGQFGDIYARKPCDKAENCIVPFGISISFSNLLEICENCKGNTTCILSQGKFESNCLESQNTKVLTFDYYNSTCYAKCNLYSPPVDITKGGEYGYFSHWEYKNLDCVRGYGLINSSVSLNLNWNLILMVFLILIIHIHT